MLYQFLYVRTWGCADDNDIDVVLSYDFKDIIHSVIHPCLRYQAVCFVPVPTMSCRFKTGGIDQGQIQIKNYVLHCLSVKIKQVALKTLFNFFLSKSL